MHDKPRDLSPVLVTGTHRSGSTWIGQMLSLSNELGPVHEPFNPINRWSWLREPPPLWFEYVTSSSGERYVDDIDRLVGLRYPASSMLLRARNTRHLGAIGRDAVDCLRWRKQGRTLLMKDPLAFFAAPWLAERFSMRPVVLVRHPAAFVSSLKRLDWRFDFANWATQATLLDGPLQAHAPLIRELAKDRVDIIDQGIALWSVMNSVVLEDYRHRAGWLVLRYEDLASRPVDAFRRLYSELGLQWSPEVESRMRALTHGPARDDTLAVDYMSVDRDSAAAMWTWQDRLSDQEVNRVRHGTSAVAQHFYTDKDWDGPDAVA